MHSAFRCGKSLTNVFFILLITLTSLPLSICIITEAHPVRTNSKPFAGFITFRSILPTISFATTSHRKLTVDHRPLYTSSRVRSTSAIGIYFELLAMLLILTVSAFGSRFKNICSFSITALRSEPYLITSSIVL